MYQKFFNYVYLRILLLGIYLKEINMYGYNMNFGDIYFSFD